MQSSRVAARGLTVASADAQMDWWRHDPEDHTAGSYRQAAKPPADWTDVRPNPDARCGPPNLTGGCILLRNRIPSHALPRESRQLRYWTGARGFFHVISDRRGAF